jgi:hypothetical protein
MYPDFEYAWQQLLLNAFVELNPVNLQSKANKAENAIRERLRDPTPTLRERAALCDALRALRVLSPQRSTDYAE